MSLKVAIVHSFYENRSPSGENIAVRDQAAALARHGYDVHLVAADSTTLATRRLYRARAALNVATFTGGDVGADLARIRPDVVHVHNLFPNLSYAWLREWGSRTVATVHNFRPICAAATLSRDNNECTMCPDKTALYSIRFRCYRDSRLATLPLAIATRGKGQKNPILHSANTVLVLNDLAHATYSKYWPNQNFVVAPNFVQPGRVEESRSAEFIYAGRLSSEKGIELLLDRWPRTSQIAIYGDGPLRKTIEEKARSSQGGIVFRGMVDRSELRESLAKCQGLIVPSVWPEGLPTVILESLASGTPIIVSRHISAAQKLSESGAGVIIDVGDRGSVENAIKYLANNKHEMSRQALRLHAKEYSEGAWMDRISPIYRNIVERGEVGPNGGGERE